MCVACVLTSVASYIVQVWSFNFPPNFKKTHIVSYRSFHVSTCRAFLLFHGGPVSYNVYHAPSSWWAFCFFQFYTITNKGVIDIIVQTTLRTKSVKCVSLKTGIVESQGMWILNFSGYHLIAFKSGRAHYLYTPQQRTFLIFPYPCQLLIYICFKYLPIGSESFLRFNVHFPYFAETGHLFITYL